MAALRNFQCNVCLRKIKTLCRHSLNFYQDELDPAEHISLDENTDLLMFAKGANMW